MKEKIYFSYEKLDAIRNPHDYRLQLKKIINAMYKGKKCSDIPMEFDLTLKGILKCKYKIFFENKDYFKEKENKHLIYDSLLFTWMKGIEDQEYGIIDN